MFALRKVVSGLDRISLRKKFKLSKRGGYMKDFTTKVEGEVGKKIFSSGTKAHTLEKEFYGQLQKDAAGRKIGDKGFTKKSLTKFYAKMLNNKEDHFIDRNILKLAEISGLKRHKVLDYASEMRRESVNIGKIESIEKKEIEIQKNKDFANHISEIRKKGFDNSRTAGILSNDESNNYSKSKQAPSHQGASNFTVSQKNIYAGQSKHIFVNSDSESKRFIPEPYITKANNSQAFGHLQFLRNKHMNFTQEEKEKMEKAKERLARMQKDANIDEDKF